MGESLIAVAGYVVLSARPHLFAVRVHEFVTKGAGAKHLDGPHTWRSTDFISFMVTFLLRYADILAPPKSWHQLRANRERV